MIVEDSSGTSHHGQKKKKRSFVQRQRRLGRHGNYGRGTQLSADMHEYFVNIMKVMNTKKEDEEEMGILASNVFNELDGKEAEYCCNQIVSRIVEDILPFSSDDEFSTFIDKFSENLRPLFSDPFGSHVLQQTLIVAFNKHKNLATDSENKLGIKFYSYILKISNFLLNNLEEFIWDTYSNAIAKTVFNVLSGNPVKGEIKQSLDDDKTSEISIPNEFKSTVKNYVKRILVWPQFGDLCNRPVTSSLLQSLLLASKECDECQELVGRTLTVYESNPLDLTLEENNPFVRLIEVVLSVADENNYKKIYKLIFKEHLSNLAISKSGNFSVQKLIVNCNSEKIFGKIFAKLDSHMEEILQVEHSGVPLALVKACRRLGLHQGDCMNMLMRTFKAKESKDLVPLICSWTHADSYNPETSTVTLHGSLVLQELMYFKKPINIVNGLLELTDSKLVKIVSDVRGSHLTDAFVKSSTIGEKSRDRLFKKLKGHFLALATSKFGSRSLDALWSVINVQQKASLAEELKASQSELCNDIHGKHFARKIHLDNYRRNPDEWIRLQKTTDSTKKLFADIIPAKKRKKNE